jgi:zinc protease
VHRPIPSPAYRVLIGLGVLIAAILFGAGPALADLDAGAVTEHTLSNGMRVLLWEDHTIPNLAIYTFWKVGSRNEAPGITGLAHFFEHMMFNGSRNYPPGEFDRTMEAAGGANNAYTSNDVTVYQDWVPASALELTLRLEQDRIGWLTVDPAVVESERGVVLSERNRSVEDDNQALMWEQLGASAFMAHPYSWPVIGWRSDIEHWRQEDVETFFRTWYTPNNAVMVVCGAFDTSRLLELLDRTVGSLPAREIPRGVVTVEPPQTGERRVQLRKEASAASVLAGWHVPATSDPDSRVLELIDLMLTSGESSRLYRRLVDREPLALFVWSGTDDNFDPGLFQILTMNRDGIDGPQVEGPLYEELERLKNEPVGEEELRKAKNMLLAGFYRDMATLSGRAQALGTYALFHGDWRTLFTAVEQYEAITPEDIMRVAGETFRPENRTVVTLIPTEAPAGEEVGDAR